VNWARHMQRSANAVGCKKIVTICGSPEVAINIPATQRDHPPLRKASSSLRMFRTRKNPLLRVMSPRGGGGLICAISGLVHSSRNKQGMRVTRRELRERSPNHCNQTISFRFILLVFSAYTQKTHASASATFTMNMVFDARTADRNVSKCKLYAAFIVRAK
jgi:hypothetical protein